MGSWEPRIDCRRIKPSSWEPWIDCRRTKPSSWEPPAIAGESNRAPGRVDWWIFRLGGTSRPGRAPTGSSRASDGAMGNAMAPVRDGESFCWPRARWRDGERNGARARWRIILLAQGAALGLACRTPEGSSCNERGAIRCGAARIGWACALARWGTQWRPCALSPCAPGDRTRRQRGHHVSDRTPRGCDILSPGQHPGRRAARRSHGTGRQLQLRAAPSSPNARC